MCANVLRQHGQVAWVSPIYQNARALWRWMTRILAPLSGTGAVNINKADRTITTQRGGILALYSADNIDGILGEAFHLVVIDEAARIAEDAWARAIQPTLADYDGHAILISTPRGKNWFYSLYLRGQDKGESDWYSKDAPTSDNPIPSIQRAARLAKSVVSENTYRQEWLAQFIEDGGEVFRNVMACAIAPMEQAARPGRTYVMGVDFGRHEDFTACVVIDVDDATMVDMERFRGVDWGIQRQRIAKLSSKWGVASVLAEANAVGEPNIEELVKMGVPVDGFNTSPKSKPRLIDNLVIAIERGDVRIQPRPVLVNELEAYTFNMSPTGNVRYGAPSGMHDDTVIALALAWKQVMWHGSPEDWVIKPR